MSKLTFLLINPVTGKNRLPAYFPLGLGYIAQVLLDQGFSVQVLDINAHRWSRDEVERRLRQANFDAVGITGMVTEFAAVRWLSRAVKEVHPGVPVILGGGLPTAFPRLALERTQADIAVVGEGEVTIKDLAESLAEGTALGKVRGIWYKEGNDLHATEPRQLIADLDTIPFPARHLFPMERYLGNPVPYLRMFDRNVVSTNMVSSRGCPYRCAYCFHGMWGYRFRGRSAESIVSEMRLLRSEFDVTGIFFMDDTFVLDRKRLLAICDRLIQEDLDVIWAASGRVNLMDRHVLEKMRAAGCRAIVYGIESGSQEILDEMRKQVTVEQARQAVLETWQAGILPVGYLMIGMPGETRQTVEETVRFCNETGIVSGFSYVTPFPGTELYERAVEMGKVDAQGVQQLLENWDEWNDRILVNLSDMRDDELKALGRAAWSKILWGNLLWKARLYVRVLGIPNAFREMWRFVRKMLRVGEYT